MDVLRKKRRHCDQDTGPWDQGYGFFILSHNGEQLFQVQLKPFKENLRYEVDNILFKEKRNFVTLSFDQGVEIYTSSHLCLLNKFPQMNKKNSNANG